VEKNKRVKLGIIYNYSSSWMGGVIYILNIIGTLDFLEDSKKPEIYLFYRCDLRKFLSEIKYPYLNAIEWNFPSPGKGYLKSFLIRKNIFVTEILSKYNLDTIFPVHDFPVKYKGRVKLVAWCADLQHKHYPGFFSKKIIIGRDIRIKLGLRNNNDLVVSSKAVKDDFVRFYKIRKDINFHIFHFVSVINNLKDIKFGDLKIKYNLPDKYFLVSNQFHKHKNHKVVLISLVKLKEKGINKHLAITGRFPNSTNSPYMAEIHRIIEENNLQDQISLLGVIPRNDQLQLMKHSQAIIQPSLFEGWSTVIEDGKSLQVPVVASNLPVNIEQLGKDGIYFNPHKPEELATILSAFPERNLSDVFYTDFKSRIINAAETLITILQP
jgi:glycosyltransferase involved in cell wall biosynthesis